MSETAVLEGALSMSATDDLLPRLSHETSQLVTRVSPGVVAVSGRGPVPSSGFVWRAGTIVTASDALERDEDIVVLTAAGDRRNATLVGHDPTTDIAVLRADAEPALAAGAMRDVAAGELAIVIGRSPDGVLPRLGMIAAAGGEWQSMRGGRIERRIQLDHRIDPRQDGGAVFGADGNFFGMAVSGPRRRGLVIPVETIERVAAQLLERGRISRAYLGLGLQPVHLDESTMKAAGISSPRALMVVSIDPSGPGQRAGVLMGDIVTAWNGERVERVRDVLRRLASETAGKRVELAVVRAGRLASVGVELGERPSP
jgi:S1-C subfamily serine protease